MIAEARLSDKAVEAPRALLLRERVVLSHPLAWRLEGPDGELTCSHCIAESISA